MTTDRSTLLFSYGTLQLEAVQMSCFGRVLMGQRDAMLGYREHMMKILDPDVVRTSGKEYHPVVVPSKTSSDEVQGMVFQITASELEAADRYEVSDYKRIETQLKSGKKAWVYVRAE